jgi:dolichol-phosphate mannosyltransferase
MNFNQMNLDQQAFSQVDDSSAPDLSVVAPCYNEQVGLDEFHRQMASVCEQLGRPYEIVLVDDGSTDRTWDKMLELASADPHLVCVKLSRNHGHQLALTAGLSVCRGKRILIIDADLQDPPKLLPDMLKLMDRGADVVYGQRRHRVAESAFKLMTATLFYRVLERMTDVAIPRDTGDFRLMSRRALDVLLAMPERHRFIRGMVSWIGFNQVPLLYDREARFAGETKYPLRKMWRLAVDAVTGFSTKPLRFANLAGFLTSLLAFGLVIFSVVSYFEGKTIVGWTSLMAVVALLSGIQMFVLGILGEYIGRLYEESKGRPLFLIDRIIRAGSAINGDQVGATSRR